MRVDYLTGFRTIKVEPDWMDDVHQALALIHQHRDEYESIERDTGVAWPFVAAIHYRESGCDFARQILNGERWDRRTTVVPEGKGPWSSWREAAIHALRDRYSNYIGKEAISFHDVQIMLAQMERWNGLGYLKQDLNSPYLWTGCQHGVGVGKYVADGNYSATAKDKQVGGAVLVHELMSNGHWKPDNKLCSLPIRLDVRGQRISQRANLFQQALNLALRDTLVEPLVEDGWIGPKTALAWTALTGVRLTEGST